MLCVGALSLARAGTDTWSAEQKEVWKNVETYWAHGAAGNTAALLEYFHADYKGWSYRNALPASKQRVAKFAAHEHKTTKTLVYDIEPVTVRVHGNVAYAHYVFTEIIKDSEGKEQNRSGRWTDILMKQGNKWVMIADHGGEVSPKT